MISKQRREVEKLAVVVIRWMIKNMKFGLQPGQDNTKRPALFKKKKKIEIEILLALLLLKSVWLLKKGKQWDEQN